MDKRVSELTPAEAKQARIDWLRQNVHYTNEPGHIACLLARLDQLEQALRVVVIQAEAGREHAELHFQNLAGDFSAIATKAKEALGPSLGGGHSG